MGFRSFIMRLCYAEVGRVPGKFMYESTGPSPVPGTASSDPISEPSVDTNPQTW